MGKWQVAGSKFHEVVGPPLEPRPQLRLQYTWSPATCQNYHLSVFLVYGSSDFCPRSRLAFCGLPVSPDFAVVVCPAVLRWVQEMSLVLSLFSFFLARRMAVMLVLKPEVRESTLSIF